VNPQYRRKDVNYYYDDSEEAIESEVSKSQNHKTKRSVLKLKCRKRQKRKFQSRDPVKNFVGILRETAKNIDKFDR